MTELNFLLDKDKCIKCGLCTKLCGFSAIEPSEEGYPECKDEKSCIMCQHCFASCPTGAISILGKKSENSIKKEAFVDPENMLNLIKTRYSCRNYKDENVSEQTIAKLKEMLAYVPTGCNNHGLHFSIIEDKEFMKSFTERALTILKQRLKFIPVFGALKKYKQRILKGQDIIFRGAPHMIVVSAPKNAPCKAYDPIIALSYFEIQANSMGLGTLWCGFAHALIKMFPEIQKKLNLPKTHELSYVMLFGYPKYNYARSVQREECSFSVLK